MKCDITRWRKTTNMAFAWIIVACLICHVAALLMMSAYYASGAAFSYAEPIRWGQLADGFSKIDVAAIRNAVSLADLLLVGLAALGLALAIWTRNEIWSIPRFVFFVIQPVLFYAGWIGLVLLVVFPFEAFKLDGEWLGERSPTLMSLGCWIAASIFIAACSLKRARPSQSHTL